MEAGHTVVGLYHLLECLVGDGEERVAAEHGLDHVIVFLDGPLGEVSVLLDGLHSLLLAVSLGYFVAEAGSHAKLFGNVLDREQRPRYLAEACVMVKDGRNAVSDAVENGRVRAGFCAVYRQMAVDVPPHSVEYLEEVGRVMAFDRQASRKA